ncbi:SDR family NAD(P)-dependent oxidoreductase [Clostridium sp. LP20]|uniref:SDR family NAD(P)-dependent oxidoreductase n=1 Tax=Clostridium sp. LP20 TaxID=3418665 RepID=UPI003EE463E9
MIKKALITGGARGIGKAIADKFKAAGYEVYTPTRMELDLANSKSVDEYIEKNKDVYFSIIINNAGINIVNKIEDTEVDTLDETMMVNLISPIKLIKAFIPKMKANNYGRIVNVGSIWAIVSKEGRGIYSATKNGIHGITNTVALEGGKYNVLINTVCPGFTITELTMQNNTKEEIEYISEQVPLKRMAKPEEIASFIYYLGSDENTYITGQKIAIDGGFTVR